MKTRRQMIQATATAATCPILSAQHTHTEVKGERTLKPRVLTADELQMLAHLVDRIIPRTDTPGASDAGVHFFIDRALHQQKRVSDFRAGWKSLDEVSGKLRNASFAALSAEDQVEVLRHASGNPDTAAGRFFGWMKNLTIDGYSTSKEGLTQELGWKGNTYLQEFKGCTHPEHQG